MKPPLSAYCIQAPAEQPVAQSRERAGGLGRPRALWHAHAQRETQRTRTRTANETPGLREGGLASSASRGLGSVREVGSHAATAGSGPGGCCECRPHHFSAAGTEHLSLRRLPVLKASSASRATIACPVSTPGPLAAGVTAHVVWSSEGVCGEGPEGRDLGGPNGSLTPPLRNTMEPGRQEASPETRRFSSPLALPEG